jgi:glyoxylase-like metal-dependent hydrolase (beta-lactamase superfamily II)
VNLRSGADHALMWGDMVHSPLQCLRPDWYFQVDTGPVQSVATRRRVLETCCEHNRLVLTAHFPAPSVGRIGREGHAFRFCYDDRER